MTFFDTVAGHRFTDATIPSLVEELKKFNKPKKQYVEMFDGSDVKEGIEKELAKGAMVVTICPADDRIVVVFSKTI